MKIIQGFTPVTPRTVKSSPFPPLKPSPLSSEKKMTIPSSADYFQSPSNEVDSPYVKNDLMIKKDASKLVTVKKHNRFDVSIEAIKCFRSLCSQETQESLDNVLIDLYKRAGRLNEHIELLQHKLQLVEDGVTYGGQRTKTARAQGNKYYCYIEQEKSRLLGNLGWAYMQQENYELAEESYRKALSIELDKNKQCNLAICLMHKGIVTEAKSLLETVKPSAAELELADSYIKSFDRATEMLSEIDSGPALKPLEQKKEPLEKQYSYSNTYSAPLRKDRRLQVFKEITLQEASMKQLNGADEAIEAFKSFRSLCSLQTQESLDNVLIDLYKKAGRMGEHIELLQRKLQILEDGGNKSHCCSAEHEKSRILGNLGWAYMQQKEYKVADEFYGKSLSVEPDEKSNQCSLGICFSQKERIWHAKCLLQNHVVGGRGLVHSNLRVSSFTTKVQQQNHGFGGKWRVDDSHSRGSAINGSDSSIGNLEPFSSFKSGKSWADMVEKDEEECSSIFSSENMVESVSECSSSEDSSYMSQETDIRLVLEKWYKKNEAIHSSDDLNDAEDNLQLRFEAVDINGEFRKPAARRSLYFDPHQEQEPLPQQYLYSNTDECAGSNRSTCSDSDNDSSGVHFPFDMDCFGDASKHVLDTVKKSIESVYVSQPPVHEKHKRGTVEYRICYRTKEKWEGLRLKVEEVGEKITACEGFITALAGNYKIAHHVCENLKQMWINEEINSDHEFLVERLGDHSTDTDFVLVTPTNAGGFQISSVTDEGVCPMVGKTSCETVEMLKEIAYEVCIHESTVGGVLTVAACEVIEKSDKDKRLKTEFFRFPPFKRVWSITILDDGIYVAKDDSFLSIDKNVLDTGILENIEEGDLSDYLFRPDLVKVRIFLDATDPEFYHASNYFERTDFMDFEDLVLSYNQAKHKFKIVLESAEKEIQELYKSM
ncbi:hypothetical protein C5167_041338, partial [Papaver somniferum]